MADTFSARHPAFPSLHALQAFCLVGSIYDAVSRREEYSGLLSNASVLIEPLLRIALDGADRRIIGARSFLRLTEGIGDDDWLMTGGCVTMARS